MWSPMASRMAFGLFKSSVEADEALRSLHRISCDVLRMDEGVILIRIIIIIVNQLSESLHMVHPSVWM